MNIEERLAELLKEHKVFVRLAVSESGETRMKTRLLDDILLDKDIKRGQKLLAMEKAGELYTLDMLQGPPTNPHCAESAADEKNEIAYWKMVGFWDSDKAHNTAGFRKVNQLKPLPEETG